MFLKRGGGEPKRRTANCTRVLIGASFPFPGGPSAVVISDCLRARSSHRHYRSSLMNRHASEGTVFSIETCSDVVLGKCPRG